jgi:insertion element IS1 protein InsB
MKCPNCQSNKIRKNGHRRGKQNYHCQECDRQFINEYTERGYSLEVKENCLKMYVNGLGFRAIVKNYGGQSQYSD